MTASVAHIHGFWFVHIFILMINKLFLIILYHKNFFKKKRGPVEKDGTPQATLSSVDVGIIPGTARFASTIL
ncbi:TPA: hypothetical protein DF272_02485 [Candidatus Falkowbacteria bacterium]|nr:hypothetical protein [Candidatus Falkowbacteria bacterium]